MRVSGECVLVLRLTDLDKLVTFIDFLVSYFLTQNPWGHCNVSVHFNGRFLRYRRNQSQLLVPFRQSWKKIRQVASETVTCMFSNTLTVCDDWLLKNWNSHPFCTYWKNNIEEIRWLHSSIIWTYLRLLSMIPSISFGKFIVNS